MAHLTGKNQTCEGGHCQVFNTGIRIHLSGEKYFKSCVPFIIFLGLSCDF